MRSWLYDILQSETLQGADIEPASGRHMDRFYPPFKNCIMCHHKLCASCIANCGHIVHHRGLLAADEGQVWRTNQVHCLVCFDGNHIEVRAAPRISNRDHYFCAAAFVFVEAILNVQR